MKKSPVAESGCCLQQSTREGINQDAERYLRTWQNASIQTQVVDRSVNQLTVSQLGHYCHIADSDTHKLLTEKDEVLIGVHTRE